jgi:hypothetical protein
VLYDDAPLAPSAGRAWAGGMVRTDAVAVFLYQLWHCVQRKCGMERFEVHAELGVV